MEKNRLRIFDFMDRRLNKAVVDNDLKKFRELVETVANEHEDSMNEFANKILAAVRAKEWKKCYGTCLSEEMHIEGDVTALINRYTAYLEAKEQYLPEYVIVRNYAFEFHVWLNFYDKIFNSVYELYNAVILNIGELVQGNFWEIRTYINDNRNIFFECPNKNAYSRKKVKLGLDWYEMRIVELEFRKKLYDAIKELEKLKLKEDMASENIFSDDEYISNQDMQKIHYGHNQRMIAFREAIDVLKKII